MTFCFMYIVKLQLVLNWSHCNLELVTININIDLYYTIVQFIKTNNGNYASLMINASLKLNLAEKKTEKLAKFKILKAVPVINSFGFCSCMHFWPLGIQN